LNKGDGPLARHLQYHEEIQGLMKKRHEDSQQDTL
ncbi:MAG: hypothetical protein QG577_1361, partial [Thermodesulfobacteriota bacterium]|nr:hypothetical protein [Thermodesulfobacteriota bacterium]